MLGLLPLFVLAHFSHHLVAALLTPLLPFIRDDFALGYTQAGGLVSAFTLSYGISQLPAGWLADRLGPRLLIFIGVSGVALFGLLVGLSQSYIMVVVFLVLMGMAGGGYHPASAPLVSASVTPQKQGRALGLHQIGGNASFSVAPLIAAGLAVAMGWRGSFITVAAPTLIVGIILYVLLGRWGYAEKAETKVPPSESTVSAPGRWRHLVVFISLSIIIQIFVFSTISFIPLFAVDHLGVSEEVGAALLTLATSAGLWAGPVGGYLSDRWGRVRLMLVVCLIAGPFIYLLNLVTAGWSVSVVLIIIGMSMYMTMPISEAYIISRTPQRNRSTVLGIYYFASRGGPGVITLMMGYLIDHFGFDVNFAIVGTILVMVTLVCAAFLWSSRD